jgi:nicotinamide-nucleotide amidase
VALLFSSFFLEKNEAKKASWLSNRSAFKGVRHDKGTLCVINRRFWYNIFMKINYENVEKIVLKLTEQKQTVSFAESCTGGRIASAFTTISGASAVLDGSCVTYSNSIKHEWLGVENEVLENYGAVSSQCVSQMLEGMQELSSANYVLATSGIAGPTGGTDLKPVGTVYIGLKTPFSQEVFQCFFHGSKPLDNQSNLSYNSVHLFK